MPSLAERIAELEVQIDRLAGVVARIAKKDRTIVADIIDLKTGEMNLQRAIAITESELKALILGPAESKT